MASSIFGGIANAISPPKLNRISYSGTLDQQLDQQTKAQEANRIANAADVARISAASGIAAKEIEKLSPGDMAVIEQIISGRQDPFQTYTSVGNYNIGLLNNLSANLAEQGRAGESRRQAALGYGGRGPSTYASNTLIDRVTRNLAPVYASTIAGISPAASAVDAGRINQNNNTVGLMDYRAGIPLRSVDAYGIPLQARAAVNQNEIAALLGLGEGYKTNTAGYREKQSPLGSVASSLDSIVDTGLSLYTGGMAGGSGAGGGMFGGLFGGGTPAAQSPAYSPVNFGPSGFSSYGGSYTGAPLAPYVPPSNYGGYGMSYSQPGAWTPPWRG